MTTSEIDASLVLRVERLRQYTYSPVRRAIQRTKALLASVAPGVLGFDVSAWQVAVDFDIAKAAGLVWAYIRALYGLVLDSKFGFHYPGAKGKLKRVAYLYYKDGEDAKAQAQKLFAVCVAEGDPGDFQPVLDLETIGNATLTAAKVKTCLEELALLFGKIPLIYSGFYVIRDALKGDKSFLAAYMLIIAAYPFVGWTDDLPEKVLNYPPMIPAPFVMWSANPDESLLGKCVGWQFTASAPASKFGSTGNFVDLDWCSPAFAKQVLGGSIPPPPEPGGDPLMKFKTKIKYNIRDVPGTPANSDVGDIPANTVVVAQEVRFTDTNSSWVRINPNPAWLAKPSPTGEYWIAGNHDGQGPFLDFVA